jgi:streptomycin 6-kinase
VPGLVVPSILHDGPGRTSSGRAWIRRLPELVDRATRRWDVGLEGPFTSGASSWCAPGVLPDGRRVVLKISFPHDEARHEAAALRAWHGHGVPALLGYDADDWALLVARVEPGGSLADAPGSAEDRLAAAAEVARALWSAHVEVAVPAVRDVCAAWADVLEERGTRHTVDVGVATHLLRTLPVGSAGVLVHGDLNPGNILSAGDGRWVAIDPKAMRGDPAYDLWPIIEQVDDPFEYPDPGAVLRARIELLAEKLDLDPWRVTAWGLARCTESALWVWDQLRDEQGARRTLERAAVWGRLLG